jgi:putative oxidoreductase
MLDRVKMLDRVMSHYERYGPLALRIAVGAIFIGHGAQKLFGAFGGYGIEGTGQFFEQLGISPGPLWATIVGLTEFFGGIAILIGFLTRYAAVPLIINMLVAILWVHLPYGFFLPQGYEYAFVLLGAGITFFVGGAGEFSVDRYLERSWRRGHVVKQPTGVAT